MYHKYYIKYWAKYYCDNDLHLTSNVLLCMFSNNECYATQPQNNMESSHIPVYSIYNNCFISQQSTKMYAVYACYINAAELFFLV